MFFYLKYKLKNGAIKTCFVLFYLTKRFQRKKLSRERLKRKGKVLFGPNSIINNKYWVEALRRNGYEAKSIAWAYLKVINTKEDFDEYLNEKNFGALKNALLQFSSLLGIRTEVNKLFLFDTYAKDFEYLVFSFDGWILGDTILWKSESKLLQFYRCKTIMFPYGGDFHRYSDLLDHSYLIGLLSHFPSAARNEEKIAERVNYWKQHSDGFFPGFLLDRIGRLDSLKFSNLAIDTENWSPDIKKWDQSQTVIVHSPNHKLIKGTEFIIKAINELKSEGHNIEFILLEKKQNSEVRQILTTRAHILIEQIILSGYGLSGVEGMASGAAVISNLEDDRRLRPFRRYSYLNECPIVSATPENIKDVLKRLINDRQTCKILASKGLDYTSKYYSYKAFSRYFKSIIEMINGGKSSDLLQLYHPLNPGALNHEHPYIHTHLAENKIP